MSGRFVLCLSSVKPRKFSGFRAHTRFPAVKDVVRAVGILTNRFLKFVAFRVLR